MRQIKYHINLASSEMETLFIIINLTFTRFWGLWGPNRRKIKKWCFFMKSIGSLPPKTNLYFLTPPLSIVVQLKETNKCFLHLKKTAFLCCLPGPRWPPAAPPGRMCLLRRSPPGRNNPPWIRLGIGTSLSLSLTLSHTHTHSLRRLSHIELSTFC